MSKKNIKVMSLVLTVAIAFVCLVAPVNAATVDKNIKLVILGDSVAAGSYVKVDRENGIDESFGNQLAIKLEDKGYDVEYINYAVPKYDTRSVWYDLNEETYAYDHNRYIKDHGAKDYREGVDYEKFIGDVKTANIVVLHLGENDLAAAFYKLRGYDDYYEFYGDEVNVPKIQKDIDEGKVSGIYTLNSIKIAKVKAEFESRIREYLDKDIKRIKELNPNVKIVVCDMFNPYQEAATYMNYMFTLLKTVPTEFIDLFKTAGFTPEFETKANKLRKDAKDLYDLLNVMIPGLVGSDINHCDKFDLSKLRTTQKILYKIAYLRCEKAAVEMYDIANKAIPEVVKANNAILCELSKTDLYKAENRDPQDKSHPNAAGHIVIADALLKALALPDAEATPAAEPPEAA
ncbi:MAG: SGNH/GDSL hydrolase family protein [Clostridia bacterium]|nr:SGNH/GDSL hydrolase family protein [Clostridia bacterium]